MSGEGATLAMPIILPATHPLPAAHRVEFGTWLADNLRQARALGPAPMSEAEEIELLLLKASLRGRSRVA